ncbi:MAG: hypothetical protein SVU69_03130 [Pseudomonadota bacterium]|nr:hypothetical protein [Pseudomonadota bacterium]
MVMIGLAGHQWVIVCLLLLLFTPALSAANILSCRDSRAAPGGLETVRYDGLLLGGNGCFYDPLSFPARQVPPFSRSDSSREPRRMFYINGASASPFGESLKYRQLVERTETHVVGVFWAAGDRSSALNAIGSNAGPNPAVATTTRLIMEHLEREEEIHLRAASAGPVILSAALTEVRRQLLIRHRNPQTANRLMQLIKAETHGSFESRFPDGPRYVHYANLLDPIPRAVGILSIGNKPGRNAVLALFSDTTIPLERQLMPLGALDEAFLRVHGFATYTTYRRPFDAVYGAGVRERGVRRVWIPHLRVPIRGF